MTDMKFAQHPNLGDTLASIRKEMIVCGEFYSIPITNGAISKSVHDFSTYDERANQSLSQVLYELRRRDIFGATITSVLQHGPKLAVIDIALEDYCGDTGFFYCRNTDHLLTAVSSGVAIHAPIGAAIYQRIAHYLPAMFWYS